MMAIRNEKNRAAAIVAPVITAEIAEELAREGEALRREYTHRVEAMWAISKDERQTRSK